MIASDPDVRLPPIAEVSAATGAVELLSGGAYLFDGTYGVCTAGSSVWVTNTQGQSVTELSGS